LVAFAAGSVGVVAAGLAASAAKVRLAVRKRRKRKGFIEDRLKGIGGRG
jgi:hypothetical protein